MATRKNKGAVEPAPAAEVPRDLSKERDEAVKPVVRELFACLAARVAKDMPIGATAGDEGVMAQYFQKVYQEDVVPVLLKHDLRLNEVSYVFSLMLQPLNFMSEVTSASIEMNRDLADAKKYGIADVDDLRISHINDTLKEQE